ncbi:MAG: hypothetical protein ACRD50_03955 [Candidatus Acidiferrales bacterium]
MIRRFALFFVAALVCASLSPPFARRPAPQTASGAEAITYRKIFKSSFPEFTEIKIHPDGSGSAELRQMDDEPNAEKFQVSAALAQRIFSLAAELHDFAGQDLDVHRRIANLGQKTFRWEKGAESHEVAFNYTTNTAASQLLSLMEGLARQQDDLSTLTRTMRYDRLGVNDVLGHIDEHLNNKILPEPAVLLPDLDQVAADDKFLDLARQRARSLAERIRAGK